MKRFSTFGVVVVIIVLVGLVKLSSARVNLDFDRFSKSVAFIYNANNFGQADEKSPRGTGFFVQVHHVSDPKAMYGMLVTARHIVDPEWAGCVGSNPTRLFLGLNTKNYDPVKDSNGITFVELDLLKNNQPSWFHPANDDVDVALIPLPSSQQMEKIDWSALLLSDFASDDELRTISPSDQVGSVGLLPTYAGVNRNYPILKIGYVSNKPNELVPVQCTPNEVNRRLRVWLISINLVSGNSGSPIVYIPEGSNGVSLGGGRPSFIGLQSVSFSGADVAGMTPADYIAEAIQELKLPDADLYRGDPAKKPVLQQQ